MKKLIPYPLYEVSAIEFWLNNLSKKNYKLINFNYPFCEFIKYSGKALHYRLGYHNDSQEIAPQFHYGNLSVYCSENALELPPSNHYNVAKVLAAQHSHIWEILLNAILCCCAGFDYIDAITTNNIILSFWSLLCLICWICHLILTLAMQLRAKGVINNTHCTEEPCPIKLNTLSYVSLKLAVIFMLFSHL